MTAKQVLEGAIIETNKVGAPSILLEDFNYYINKVIYQYVNKRYNIYDINQQTTDDLRVLKGQCHLTPKKSYDINDTKSRLAYEHPSLTSLQGATYEVELPIDYLHLLNCMCVYEVQKPAKQCYNTGDIVMFPAKRLTADTWSTVANDYYTRPNYQRPYYYIHNVNTSSDYPYNPVNTNGGTDMSGTYLVTGNPTLGGENQYSESVNSNFPRTISLNGGGTISTVERATAQRYGNASKVRMEIRYGRDDSVFRLVDVQVDYIKTPQHIKLTQDQMDLDEDTSQIMEFPDCVCQEIINELVMVLMERAGDPRIQTHIAVTQSVANPVQQQAQASD